MVPRVVPVQGAPRWDPNIQIEVLIWQGNRVVLSLAPHFDDPDTRPVVFEWAGAHLATIGYPNDEGIWEHPLYSSGLNGLLWMGEILDPESLPLGYRRYIVPMKENLADVTARSFRVHRVEGSQLTAAVQVISDLS